MTAAEARAKAVAEVAEAAMLPSPAWPDQVRVPGLHAPAEITRDVLGIPAVHAGSLEDAVRGLGYVTGMDRMFQLDLQRRRASGRLAEILGPHAVGEDIRQRRLDLTRVAADHLAALPARHRALLDAYADGVNLALDSGPLAFELRIAGVRPAPWSAVDSMLVAFLIAQSASSDGTDRICSATMRRCLPPEVAAFLLSEADPYRVDACGEAAQPRTVPVPVAGIETLIACAGPARGRSVIADDLPWGSNVVAIAGHRSASGQATLASDMHLPLTVPSLFYRAALRWPGGAVDGVVVPGTPMFLAGSTGDLAWGVTRLGADTVDRVELVASETHPDSYLTPGGPAPFGHRQERIDVLGAEPVVVDFLDTTWGPADHRGQTGQKLRALRWTCREPGGLNLGLADLLIARDVDEAVDVATAFAGPPLNVVIADRAGRIAWCLAGSYPARTADAPNDSDDQAGRWSGLLPPASLPRLADPPGGLIVNANNAMAGQDWPPQITVNHFGGQRAARIGELLRDRSGLTEADLFDLQRDTTADFYEFYRQLALGVLDTAAIGTSPELQSLRSGIESWPGTAEPADVGIAALIIFRELLRDTWFGCLLADCTAADPEFRYRWHNHEAPLRALLSQPDLAPKPYRTRRAFLLGELGLTIRLLGRLAAQTPPGEVEWGTLNPSDVRHPLSRSFPALAGMLDLDQAPLPGCAETVCATRPGFGPAFRLVAAPGRLEQALANLPGGQSGNPADPTYRDQYRTWLAASQAPLGPLGDGGRTQLLPQEERP